MTTSPAPDHDQQSQEQRTAAAVGPNAPTPPFPVRLAGAVARGFGRGSRELGIPTANLPDDAAEAASSILDTGIYYGWAAVDNYVGNDDPRGSLSQSQDSKLPIAGSIYPMVMSYGWNPYYNNSKRTAEVHIIHTFPTDFYGSTLRVVVAGFIRTERNYACIDDLVADINIDIASAKLSLLRAPYAALRDDPFLLPEHLRPKTT